MDYTPISRLMGFYNAWKIHEWQKGALDCHMILPGHLQHSHSFISHKDNKTRTTLIDHIFTHFSASNIDFSGSISQMFLTCFQSLCCFYQGSLCEGRHRRNMSQQTKVLLALDCNKIYQLSDTQTAFGWFHQFLFVHNKCFPKRKVKLKCNTRKMWLTHG